MERSLADRNTHLIFFDGVESVDLVQFTILAANQHDSASADGVHTSLKKKGALFACKAA